MNMTLIYILLGIFGTIFAIGIPVLIYIFGRLSVKDDSSKALVFVKTGRHISKPYKGKQSESSNRGVSYMYGKNKVVFVPTKYGEDYHRSKRLIFVSHLGQLIASPFDSEVVLSESEMESLIYELCASHVGADGMRALKGKGALPIILVGIIAFILGALGVLAVGYFQSRMTEDTQPVITDDATQIETPRIEPDFVIPDEMEVR